jgi:hypothetical protein
MLRLTYIAANTSWRYLNELCRIAVATRAESGCGPNRQPTLSVHVDVSGGARCRTGATRSRPQPNTRTPTHTHAQCTCAHKCTAHLCGACVQMRLHRADTGLGWHESGTDVNNGTHDLSLAAHFVQTTHAHCAGTTWYSKTTFGFECTVVASKYPQCVRRVRVAVAVPQSQLPTYVGSVRLLACRPASVLNCAGSESGRGVGTSPVHAATEPTWPEHSGTCRPVVVAKIGVSGANQDGRKARTPHGRNGCCRPTFLQQLRACVERKQATSREAGSPTGSQDSPGVSSC